MDGGLQYAYAYPGGQPQRPSYVSPPPAQPAMYMHAAPQPVQYAQQHPVFAQPMTAPRVVPAGPPGAVGLDFNRDGRPELIVAGGGAMYQGQQVNGSLPMQQQDGYQLQQDAYGATMPAAYGGTVPSYVQDAYGATMPAPYGGTVPSYVQDGYGATAPSYGGAILQDGYAAGGATYVQDGYYAATVPSYGDEVLQENYHEERVRVSMVVPDGAAPGTKLTYTAPDGQELRLTVPEGVPPGSVMTLTQDPATKQWKCMAEPMDAPYGTAATQPQGAYEQYHAAAMGRAMPGPAITERVTTYIAGQPPITSYVAPGAPAVRTAQGQLVMGQPMPVNLSYVPPPPMHGGVPGMPGQVVLPGQPSAFNPPRQDPGYPPDQQRSYVPPMQVIYDQRPSYVPPPGQVVIDNRSFTPMPQALPPGMTLMGPYGQPLDPNSLGQVGPHHVALHHAPSYVPPPPMIMHAIPSYVPPPPAGGTMPAPGQPGPSITTLPSPSTQGQPGPHGQPLPQGMPPQHFHPPPGAPVFHPVQFHHPMGLGMPPPMGMQQMGPPMGHPGGPPFQLPMGHPMMGGFMQQGPPMMRPMEGLGSVGMPPHMLAHQPMMGQPQPPPGSQIRTLAPQHHHQQPQSGMDPSP